MKKQKNHTWLLQPALFSYILPLEFAISRYSSFSAPSIRTNTAGFVTPLFIRWGLSRGKDMYNFENNKGIVGNFSPITLGVKIIVRTILGPGGEFSTASAGVLTENSKEIKGGNRFPHIHNSNSIRI